MAASRASSPPVALVAPKVQALKRLVVVAAILFHPLSAIVLPLPAAPMAVEVMGAGRLLFGTDSTFFPRGWRKDVFEEQVKVFQEAGLSGDQVTRYRKAIARCLRGERDQVAFLRVTPSARRRG